MNTELQSLNIMTDISLDKMGTEKKERIFEIRDGIDISNDQAIMKIGSETSKNITALNKTVLSTIKVKDIPEIESILPQLNDAFKEVDSSTLLKKKPNFFARLFKNADPIKDFMAKFENASAVVSNIQTNLQKVEMELRKDIEIEDGLGRKNIQYIEDLTETIIGMKLRLNQELEILEEKQAQVSETDYVELQYLAEQQDQIDGLDRQIYWLEQQRMLAIQTLPLLRNMKNNNRNMIRQITLTVQQSIPAWEQGIIIAFHLHRQEGALRIERAVHTITNQLVLQNSQLLKENSIEIAKAVESGMIDMETFRQANNNIIETSKKLTELKNSSMKQRQENIEEYRKLTQQLIEAEKRDIIALTGTTLKGEITDGHK